MPATEKTWYDQKLLHVIFGCTALIMLVSVIWMVAQDHEREWKDVQRDFRGIQKKELLGRLRFEEKKNGDIVKQAEMQLAAAQSQLPEAALIEQFKATSKEVGDGEFSFSAVDDSYADLQVQSGIAQKAMDAYQALQVQLRNAEGAVTSATDDAARSTAMQSFQSLRDSLPASEETLVDAQDDAIRLRGNLLKPLNKVAAEAKHLMNLATNEKKLATARFAQQTATQGLLLGKDQPEKAAGMQELIDSKYKVELDEATALQEQTTSVRNRLRALLNEMAGSETEAKKQLEEAVAERTRLQSAINEVDINYFSLTSLLGKKMLELPIVDGFHGPLTIDNLWTEGLKMPNGSFGEVRRFDRCTTCHKGIDKTAPGSATIPAYQKRHEVVVRLATPATPPASDASLTDIFGIGLAEVGYLERNDVTIETVAATSLAATAVNVSDSACAGGLMEGDVIRYVGGDRVSSPREAFKFLTSPLNGWGSSLEVVVERGLPQPYTSHPRLDLYVGSLSPHKLSDIGCTVCHEGEGSGTSFNYTSHTPNSLEQEDEWRKERGWFSNHHWIYPMMPARFTESTCLKCHHEVVELAASERFPETPAPKLLAGHNLIQAYGCYGCHEINGYKSPTERVGPDMRLEPNYFAAAAELSHNASFQQLPVEEQALAHHLVQHPEDDQVRHQLLAAMQADAVAETPKLTAAAMKLSEVLGDLETPGSLRKVGPSLRHVGNKLGKAFLFDWIADPKHFRPSTKMPQVFGMWDHLQEEPRALAKAQAYEPVEIMGIVTYLLDRTQPMQHVEAEGEMLGDAERGKSAFEIRGCMACHQHSAFDDTEYGTIASQPRPGVSRQMQGPDLSNVGDKLGLADTPDAKQWLYTWLRNPQLYHPRTKMPDLYLLKEKAADGTETDAAADIAAFLMESSNGWKPTVAEPSVESKLVEEVAYEYLKKAFFGVDAKRYIETGIPEDIAATLKGSEVELANVGGNKGDMNAKLLKYIGAKTIGKYGCYGCHDIAGFEAAKPIGVGLADWGRKETSKIAFEHIAEYIAHGHGHAASHDDEHVTDEHATDDHASDEHSDHAAADSHAAEGDEIDPHFYEHYLKHHDRTGFLWQKLKEPRSYDYKKADNKDYNDKLRMPMFGFTDVQREEVMTFILGLVSEPPAKQFIFQPDTRQHAIIEGQKVIDKYNCAGCHVFETERWDIEYRPGEFEPPFADTTSFPFMNAHLPTNELVASNTPDKQRGSLKGVLRGMPTITHPGREENAQPVMFEYDSEDEEWYPVEAGEDYDASSIKRSITLWDPSAIEGNTMDVGQVLDIPASAIKQRHAAFGGDLTFRLLPRVLELEKEANAAAKGGEAWGWLAPSLHNEGSKVQPEWLHSFLLEPHVIRPASFLRMPKFNMSPAEATAIVNYFAAKANATYPYEYESRTSTQQLDRLEKDYVEQSGASDDGGLARLNAGMNIVTYKDYCVQCHVVSDYDPGGSIRAKAPNLANVYKRLRSDYVRNWIAKPTRILPYTPMPVVIPYAGAQLVPQTMYHGAPTEQLDGVVDLLMNYDRYTAGQTTVKDMVKKESTTAAQP